ncbi:MAG TPA: ABC transporter permease [Gemmatimonadaceae bacterium]|nr:ABC transporter permease [Gemmatimonadaceae bacterium]
MSMASTLVRYYRAALRLYPATFRDRFADEMLEFAESRLSEARARGGGAVVAAGVRLATDLIVTVPREWRAERHERRIARRVARHAAAADPLATRNDMDILRQDLRFAVRGLMRRPAFTIVAALTLALGTGANTAIFSLVNAVLIRPLPYPDPDRLVILDGTQNGEGGQGVVYADYVDWRQQNHSFADMAVLRPQSINLTGGDHPDRVIGSFVSASFLRVIGAKMALGRAFTDRETELQTESPVAIVSYEAWQTRFGGDSSLVGRTLVLNGSPFTVIGVTGPHTPAVYGDMPDVLVPVGYYPNAHGLDRGTRGVAVVARLRPGVTIAAAQRDLSAIEDRLAQAYPTTNAGTGANVIALKDMLVDARGRARLLILLAAVGVVLLIACANVANLQLARGAARARELSVRAALGAGRARIARQSLTESIILSLFGGALGVLLAIPLLRWLVSLVGPQLPVDSSTIHLDARVLAFALLIALATGVLFGLPAAFKASRTDVGDMLRVRAGGLAHAATRNSLVVVQLALSMALLASAGLLVRSLIALQHVDPGFDAEHLLTAQFRLPNSKYDSPAKITAMFDQTIAAIRAVPGVESAALVRASPLSGNGETYPIALEGRAAAQPNAGPSMLINSITPRYFATMRIPIVAGRDVSPSDRDGTLPAIVINERAAKQLWPGESAIGKRVQVSERWWTVVGVVGDVKHFTLGETPLLEGYVPHAQRPQVFTSLVVRTQGDPLRYVTAVRNAIWSVDRDQPVWRFKSMAQDVSASVTAPKTLMWLAGLFAFVALVVAAVGVYGVLSYTMSLRTQEIGIRIALGADARGVVAMVLREGGTLVALSVGIGVAIALGATRLMQSQLFGVGATDAITFVAAVGVLSAVALIACYLPARRASRVDPVVALRTD